MSGRRPGVRRVRRTAAALVADAQRRGAVAVGLGLPDASVLVLQGFAFVFILAAEALRGRLFPLRMPSLVRLRVVASMGRAV